MKHCAIAPIAGGSATPTAAPDWKLTPQDRAEPDRYLLSLAPDDDSHDLGSVPVVLRVVGRVDVAVHARNGLGEAHVSLHATGPIRSSVKVHRGIAVCPRIRTGLASLKSTVRQDFPYGPGGYVHQAGRAALAERRRSWSDMGSEVGCGVLVVVPGPVHSNDELDQFIVLD